MVVRSSVEIKFRAMAQGICELLWIKIILIDLDITLKGPIMRLYCDNQTAININHNPVHDRHFIKEKPYCGLICTPHLQNSWQIL